MCGILGVISSDNSTTIDEASVLRMRDTMVARGPDEQGFFREANITLAHRRLAIRDASNGKQPWISQNGRFVFVYNGEIYNDKEIRADLHKQGIRTHTRCDTEILAEAWSAWGPKCLDRLRGMFAFAVIDRNTKQCWLVRDRCGIKPLFYSQIQGDFVFASSISAIRKHPHFSSQPNFAAISHYLQTLRITLGKQTVFENVYTLEPAEIIRFESGRLHHQIYWSPPCSTTCDNVDFQEAVEELESTLSESIQLRLRSDVDVGMMMSGGVDSNTLATMTKQQSSRSIVGVCGGGESQTKAEEVGSDFQFANDCANEVGFDYSEVRVSPESYLDTWQTLITDHSTPLATPTDPIIYRVAKRLKQSVGVALGGEGADEAFCGYAIPHWSANDFERSFNLGDVQAIESIQFRQSLMSQYGRDHFESASDHYLGLNGLIPWSAQRALFNDHCLIPEDHVAVKSHYESLFNANSHLPMAERYARVLHQVNLESLLRRLDSATMSASLEARVPYADHVLVEKAFQLPHHFKIDVCPHERQPWLASFELAKRGSLRTKRVLRELASRLMPARLAQRPKMSFPTPITKWLSGPWQAWIANKLNKSPFARELFRQSSITEVTRLPSTLSLWKWPIVNTVLWGEASF